MIDPISSIRNWARWVVLVAIVVGPARLAWAAPAGGADRSVAVLPIDYGDGEIPGFSAQLDSALREGIERGRITIIPASEIEPYLGKGGACDQACLAGILASTSAWMIVRPRVRARDRTFEVQLDATATASGASAVSVDETCEICGKQEVVRTLADLGAALAQGLEAKSAAKPMFAVQTEPAGARISIDGEFVGNAPLDVEVTPGEHELVVELGGHMRQTQTVTGVSGVRTSLQLNLQPESLDPAEQARLARRSRTFIAAGGAGMGVGLIVGMAAGIPLLLLDSQQIEGRCTGKDVDLNGTCRYSYDTLGGGIAALSIGAAVAVAGAVVLAIGLRTQPMRGAETARLRPSVRGLTLAF